MASRVTYHRLRVFNLVMFVLHALQGLAVLLLTTDFALPVTSSFVQFDAMTGTLAPRLNTLLELPIGPLVALFFFLSAVAHLAVSLPTIFEWYTRNLGRGINRARWIEYAVSSSVMIVVISMLVGIYDGVLLLMIALLNAMMILFGLLMELHNQTTRRTNWTSFWFGSLAGLGPWIAIAIFLVGAGSGAGEVPTFVYWIFGSLFVFFNLFAINMVLQYKKVGPWRDYLYGERVYIILSLVAKSLLAWQVFAGTLRPV
ncbi:MAG: heliorhodopsin HeR [bacterium]|nr:heliorhodopsin HeR [bacterium]